MTETDMPHHFPEFWHKTAPFSFNSFFTTLISETPVLWRAKQRAFGNELKWLGEVLEIEG